MTAVVILPGLDGTGALLNTFFATLETHGITAKAIAYPTDLPMNYDELEFMVRAQLPKSGSFVLLGESFSGPIAVRIAANPPPGQAGLILSTTFARTPVPALLPYAPLIRFAPTRPPMPLLSWLLLGAWATSELQSQLSAALHTVDPAVLRTRASSALLGDVSALLPSVQMPVLQLMASHDRLLAPVVAEILSAGLSTCRTIAIPGPHLLLQTATQSCAHEVAAFVSTLARDD